MKSTIFSLIGLGLLSITIQAMADQSLDDALVAVLKQHGFSGTTEEQVPKNLGRSLDPKKVDLGRLIFFDKGLGIHQTNSCAGCHSPTAGFGDTQAIAIGIGNNDQVGPGRTGARNQRRTPSIINTGTYPALMWNSRFSSNSGDPFNTRLGFTFPLPEGQHFFQANDPRINHLLTAQAHIPFTELPEMAGFGGLSKSTNKAVVFSRFNLAKSLKSRSIRVANLPNNPTPDRPIDDENDFKQFDDVPPNEPARFLPDAFHEVPSLNNPIRHKVIQIINSFGEYRERFGQIYPSVHDGNGIEFYMIGQVVAEFQISLTHTNAPIDRYARGDKAALNEQQKRGALIFFGKANCVSCHSVSGKANEMFSDFDSHCAGIPPIAPVFGKGTGNVPFRNSEGELTIQGKYDIGLADITGIELDRFKFRTSPLRNVSLQPHFFHNGSFDKLEDAIWFHLDATTASKTYVPSKYGVPTDLQNMGEFSVVLEHLAPQLRTLPSLTAEETAALVSFVRDGLLDDRAKAEHLRKLIPTKLPTGQSLPIFE